MWCPHAEQGHHDPSTGHQTAPREKIFVDEELTNLIDPILNMDDTDGDGYIDYPEFVKAQQKAAAAAHTGKPTWARYVSTKVLEKITVGIDNQLREDANIADWVLDDFRSPFYQGRNGFIAIFWPR